MTKIKLVLTIISLLFYCQIVSAQNRKISGIVTFSDSLKSLMGASVNVKGTNIGTLTDKSGRYALNVPQSA